MSSLLQQMGPMASRILTTLVAATTFLPSMLLIPALHPLDRTIKKVTTAKAAAAVEEVIGTLAGVVATTIWTSLVTTSRAITTLIITRGRRLPVGRRRSAR